MKIGRRLGYLRRVKIIVWKSGKLNDLGRLSCDILVVMGFPYGPQGK